jgi:HSP20 family protein
MFSLTPNRKERDGNRALAPRADHPFALLRQEFDSLFDRVFGHWPALPGWDVPAWDFGVEDAGNEYVVRAEAPGFEANEIDVQVAGDQLYIRAGHKEESHEGEEQGGNQRTFERWVTLPGGADLDKVEARYRNGVLEVHLPKTPEAQGRRIQVKT